MTTPPRPMRPPRRTSDTKKNPNIVTLYAQHPELWVCLRGIAESHGISLSAFVERTLAMDIGWTGTDGTVSVGLPVDEATNRELQAYVAQVCASHKLKGA